MAAQVKMFAYSGLSIAKVASYSEQQSFPALTLLKQPYLSRESITATTGSAQSTTTALSPEHTRLLQIQVEPGKRVHLEVNPPGRTNGPVAADTSSPIIESSTLVDFGSGWVVSLLEAS